MSETILTMDDRLPAPIAQLPNFDEEQLQATPNMTPRIADAAFDGYWQPGWEILHYFQHAPRINGFENCVVWGPKGSYKSNREVWLAWAVYEDFDKIWDSFVMHPETFIELIRSPGRIPHLTWDDCASYLDSTLYFDDRKLYTKIKRYWWLLRTKISNFVSSTPHKGRMAGFILDDMTSECKCSPRANFNYDRWAWRINYKNSKKVDMFPVNIHQRRRFNYKFLEYSRIYNEETQKLEPDPRMGIWFPKKEWDHYWKMRLEFSERGGKNLEAVMKEAFKEPPDINEIVDSAVKNNNLEKDEDILKFLASKAARIQGLNSAYQRTGDPKTKEKIFNIADDLGLLEEAKKVIKA